MKYDQMWEWYPMPRIKVFTNHKKARKWIKKYTGCESQWLGKNAQTDYISEDLHAESLAVITIDGRIKNTKQKIAILAHECSHVVDYWLNDMGEEEPGGEIRAYAIQSVMMACLEQLGESWLIPQTKDTNEK